MFFRHTQHLFRSLCLAGMAFVVLPSAAARQQPAAPPPAQTPETFSLGEIVDVLGSGSVPGIGGAIVTHEQLWTFDRTTLDQAVNLIPGVVSTFDANGRRNESDIFVRGFGRWQVPLMVDGVRVYLPADNRLDFSRFLTADIAAIQVQKGYASVLDGPGAMGGAINLVTAKPTRPLEVEGGVSTGGRDLEGWNAYAMVGARRSKGYVQASTAISDRNSWSLSGRYQPPAGSLQPSGERLGSDTADWRLNVKAGYTPTAANEYVINYTRQEGEKGAPLNVFNNPPVPPNSYWRWPQWDVQSTSLLTTTQLGPASYLKAKAYYNTFENVLDAFDDGTYALQSANGRFRSPYKDHAYGTSIEVGTTPVARNTTKGAFHYRTDVHREQQTTRPTHPTLAFSEPVQEQSQDTWSLALENTFRITSSVDLVAGVSYDHYAITRAEEYTAARGSFEYPLGGADAFNWQSALVWRHQPTGEWHASVSDRARFPMIFELYSTRFGTATPNPDLGPERATNVEIGWAQTLAGGTRLAVAGFYSDVRDMIQTVVLPDTTTQTQNVGDGDFKGLELSMDAPIGRRLRVGGNYTLIRRTITDALQPNLRPTGVPDNRAFLHLAWQASRALRVTPNLELADDRWSDLNPAPAFPYVKTGAYALLNVDATYAVARGIDLSAGFKNLLDDDYQLAWGYPQPGRTFYGRTRLRFSPTMTSRTPPPLASLAIGLVRSSSLCVVMFAALSVGARAQTASAQTAPPAGPTQPAASSSGGIAITGAVRTPLTITAKELASMPRTTVETKDDGRSVVYEGVLVGELLKRAGATLGTELRGDAMATYVVATASDGYRVLFSLAELDPAFTASEVIVADTVDGKPLFAYQGPFRIVAPKDGRGARSIRMVQRLEVVRLGK